MEWFFVARDVQSKKSYVWDQGQKILSLPAGAEQTEVVESTELVRTSAKSSRTDLLKDPYGQVVGASITHSSSETGARPYGWIVRMWNGDRLVQVRTSSNDLQALGRSLNPVE